MYESNKDREERKGRELKTEERLIKRKYVRTEEGGRERKTREREEELWKTRRQV